MEALFTKANLSTIFPQYLSLKILGYFMDFTFVFLLPCSVLAQYTGNPLVDDQLIFDGKNDIITVEAEHFFHQSLRDKREWVGITEYNAHEFYDAGLGKQWEDAGGRSYIKLLPDTRVTHDDQLIHGENFSNEPGLLAILHYKVNIKNPGRYYVWVRAFSSGTEDNGLHVGIDGAWPESGQRMQWCEGKNSWKWDSKQRTDAEHCGEPYKIFLDIENPGIHEVQFSMREDGFEFDRFLLTNNIDHVPTGLGPEIQIHTGL